MLQTEPYLLQGDSMPASSISLWGFDEHISSLHLEILQRVLGHHNQVWKSAQYRMPGILFSNKVNGLCHR